MAHKSTRSSLSRKSNKARKKDTIQPGFPFNDLGVQFQNDDYSTSKKHVKSTSTREKDVEPTHRIESGVTSNVNADAVPDPIPDSGLSSKASLASAFSVYTGVLPVVPSLTGTLSAPTAIPGFSPLPPFASLAATTIASISSISSMPSSTSGVPSASTEAKQSQVQSQPKHLSTVITVLIVIGVACLLLVVFIVIRSCNKPHRRTYPTPSLPILQDGFSDRNIKDDEESLFGGKERISGRPGSNGLWTWTQYSQPSVLRAEPPNSGTQNRLGDDMQGKGYQSIKPPSPGFNEKTSYRPLNSSASTRVPPRPQPPVHEAPSVVTRAAKRVSAMSMSIYPGSPQSAQSSFGVGLAIGGPSPLTADGMPVLQRNVSKASTRRLSRNRRSVRHSMHERSGGPDGGGDADIYGGVQMMSPVAPLPASALKKSNSVQGRARVKAPYAAGAVLPTSSTVSAFNGASNPFDDSQYVLPPISPALKSDALRERDTRALTTALGLASPIPPSPQPTIYPDDSVTLAGDRRETRTTTKARPQSESLSPGMEASARLGNLMLAEFSSMASLPSTRTVVGTGEDAANVTRNKSTRKRTEDKPPRVPSPPPMPSLAQMALAHTNPDAYADYRSPTYSIYGLYEADRKSRAPGEGGY